MGQGQDLRCNQLGIELQLLQSGASAAGFGVGLCLKERFGSNVCQRAWSSPVSAGTAYVGTVLGCIAVSLKREWAPLKVQHCRGLVKILELKQMSTHTTSQNKDLNRAQFSLSTFAVCLLGSYMLISYT